MTTPKEKWMRCPAQIPQAAYVGTHPDDAFWLELGERVKRRNAELEQEDRQREELAALVYVPTAGWEPREAEKRLRHAAMYGMGAQKFLCAYPKPRHTRGYLARFAYRVAAEVTFYALAAALTLGVTAALIGGL